MNMHNLHWYTRKGEVLCEDKLNSNIKTMHLMVRLTIPRSSEYPWDNPTEDKRCYCSKN